MIGNGECYLKTSKLNSSIQIKFEEKLSNHSDE